MQHRFNDGFGSHFFLLFLLSSELKVFSTLTRDCTGTVRDLKLELAMHDTLAGRGRITYDPYTPEE